MTERIRVLAALLHFVDREFTVFDIAEKTGVNIATVRTVLNRERRFLRELGRLEADSRGGRAMRFALQPETIAGLQQEVLQTHEAILQLGTANKINTLDLPTLMAAQDIVCRQVYEADQMEDRSELLAAARRYLSASSETLDQMDEDGANVWTPRMLIKGLQQHCHEIAQEMGLVIIPEVRIPELNPLELYNKSLENARAVCGTAESSLSNYPAQVLEAAASYFEAHSPKSDVTDPAINKVANEIRRSVNPKFDFEYLIILGRAPAAYQKGILRISQSSGRPTVSVNSQPFFRECLRISERRDAPDFPIQAKLLSIDYA